MQQLKTLLRLIWVLWQHADKIQLSSTPESFILLHKWGLSLQLTADGNFTVLHRGIARYNARYLLHNCAATFNPEEESASSETVGSRTVLRPIPSLKPEVNTAAALHTESCSHCGKSNPSYSVAEN